MGKLRKQKREEVGLLSRHERRSRSSVLALFAALIMIVATAMIAGGSVAQASADGNNGTIKIHEQGTPSGTESNDPKVCVFNIEGFGFDAGQSGYLYIDVQGGDEPTGTPAGPFDFGPTNDDGYYATQYFNLDPGHYKATLYGKPGREDEKAKSKVFKVQCEVTPPPVTEVTPLAPTATTPSCDNTYMTVSHSDQEGVVWNYNQVILKVGESVTFTASPAEGYKFPEGAQTSWSSTNTFDYNKTCVETTPVQYVCPNLGQNLTEIPRGYVELADGTCVIEKAPKPTPQPVPQTGA